MHNICRKKLKLNLDTNTLFIIYFIYTQCKCTYCVCVYIAEVSASINWVCLLFSMLTVCITYVSFILFTTTNKKKPKQNPHLILAKQVKWGSTLGLTAGYALPTV